MSKTYEKKLLAQARQQETILTIKQQKAEERWTNAQIKAAGFQSVLDYAVDQFNQHKEELEKEMITKTEDMIKERQTEIETYLMTEKDLYLEAMGIQAD